ncbi:hypothetical protein Sru01_41040 [Sphaerisporangium rufum]|uniref:Uncharacterized protein n=1 Tax=Sphaerisporangium rufum TaxID=1381558 RepID=A0A919V1Y0_9ACTN|nr:hypothetical protein [Sphaerisporangium rufum]GII79122.1 hypothetical protein Sru01_41040 [Sphaerisporangium rufum]
MKRNPAAARRALPGSPFNVPTPPPPPLEHFVVEDLVSHDKYGLGRVIGVDDDVAVLVSFGTENYRISAPYTKLVKL